MIDDEALMIAWRKEADHKGIKADEDDDEGYSCAAVDGVAMSQAWAYSDCLLLLLLHLLLQGIGAWEALEKGRREEMISQALLLNPGSSYQRDNDAFDSC